MSVCLHPSWFFLCVCVWGGGVAGDYICVYRILFLLSAVIVLAYFLMYIFVLFVLLVV